MKNLTYLTIAVALLSGASLANAAPVSRSSTTGSASSMSQAAAKDKLSLTATQQNTAWKDISAQATKEKAPANFSAKLGAVVPSSLETHPVPVSTTNKVPLLRPYQYAMLSSNKLLIVNPDDHKVAAIIAKYAREGPGAGARPAPPRRTGHREKGSAREELVSLLCRALAGA